MNGPVALLHVVRGEEVHDICQPKEEVVLEAEHRGGSDNSGLREDASDDLFTTGLIGTIISHEG